MKHIIVKQIHFCYGHRLMDYNGKCSHPHGHNGTVEVELCSDTLDALGMVCDFTEVKKVVKGFIDEKIDHRMLLRHDDPLIPLLRSINEEPYIMQNNPTAENIAQMIFEEVKKTALPVIAIRVWETLHAYGEYRIN